MDVQQFFFRAAHLHCVLAQRVEPRVKVPAGDSGFDAFPVDNVQEADVAERVSRIGTDGVEEEENFAKSSF